MVAQHREVLGDRRARDVEVPRQLPDRQPGFVGRDDVLARIGDASLSNPSPRTSSIGRATMIRPEITQSRIGIAATQASQMCQRLSLCLIRPIRSPFVIPAT